MSSRNHSALEGNMLFDGKVKSAFGATASWVKKSENPSKKKQVKNIIITITTGKAHGKTHLISWNK